MKRKTKIVAQEKGLTNMKNPIKGYDDILGVCDNTCWLGGCVSQCEQACSGDPTLHDTELGCGTHYALIYFEAI